jgi:hypothetical protein
MLSAPKLGVRHSRRLPGVACVTRERWRDATPWDDEIGVSPSLSPKVPPVSVPYCCLVPRAVPVGGVSAGGGGGGCRIDVGPRLAGVSFHRG